MLMGERTATVIKNRKHLDRSSIDAHVGISHLTKNSMGCCLSHCATPIFTRRESTCFLFDSPKMWKSRSGLSGLFAAYCGTSHSMAVCWSWALWTNGRHGLGACGLQSSNWLSCYGRCSNILRTFFFIVVLCISMSLKVIHQQMYFFIKFKKALKFTLKVTLSLLLHVSVYDHHQGAYARDWLKLY